MEFNSFNEKFSLLAKNLIRSCTRHCRSKSETKCRKQTDGNSWIRRSATHGDHQAVYILW